MTGLHLKVRLVANMVMSISAFALSGCASLPRTPDLHRKADAMFEDLEQEKMNNPSSSNYQEPPAIGKTVSEGKTTTFKFEETGRWKMSKAESQLFAEQQAENDALAKALRATGAEAYYGFSDVLGQAGEKGTEAVSRYLQVWSKGVLKWERVGGAEITPTAEGLFECSLRIKGEVVFNGEPDPAFEIKLQAGGRELGLSRTVLKDGESVEFAALVTKPAYLQILSVDQDQNVYLVYPNSFSKFSKVPAGQVFQFPPAGSSLGLRAAIPPGNEQATEAIQVIATKTEPLFNKTYFTQAAADEAPPALKLKEVMEKLAKLKRSEWTMVVLPYQIIK